MRRKTTKRPKNTDKLSFGLSVEVHQENGTIEAVYFQIRKGKAVNVVERENGAVFLNYDKDGRLLGVELLAPCSVTVLDSIAQKEPFSKRRNVKGFLRKSVPRQMVAAA